LGFQVWGFGARGVGFGGLESGIWGFVLVCGLLGVNLSDFLVTLVALRRNWLLNISFSWPGIDLYDHSANLLADFRII